MKLATFGRGITPGRAFLFALLLAAGACATARVSPHEQPVRVVSYNIQYGGGGGNLAAVLEVIRGLDADIVALQEVDVHWSARSAFADQAAALAEGLGMQVRFAPIYSIPDTGDTRPPRRFGVALLSRHPIVHFTNHPLTRLSTQSANPVPSPQPGFLEAVVNVGGTRLRVFNTHLDYRRDPAVRRQQVAEMLELIGSSPETTVLFGDLNAPPHAPELQPLFARLRDAWPAEQGPGHTFPAAAPEARIDYVLVSNDVEVHGAAVPVMTAADHRPVVVDIVLRR